MAYTVYVWHVFYGGRSVGTIRATLAYAQMLLREAGVTGVIDWKTGCSAR